MYFKNNPRGSVQKTRKKKNNPLKVSIMNLHLPFQNIIKNLHLLTIIRIIFLLLIIKILSSSSSPRPKFEEKPSNIKCFKYLGYGHKSLTYPKQKGNGDEEWKDKNLLFFLLLLLLLLQPLVHLIPRIVSVNFLLRMVTCWW